MVSDKEAPKKPVSKKGSTAVQSKDRDMGAALRSIYQKTIDEQIPDEFVSLLGKLD
ncbi:NepR family anti-sigma factor [Sphingomonas sp.]|uniref:NepR family anti-sigma factor n=1 Tax=Sphingomonas sp. TaxID=28214 RepID=UPI0026345068|nr:NepR family anti-sigma factor [Sphingomonas sp.]